MVDGRLRAPRARRGQRRLAVALHALGVGAVERQAGEELGRHAAAAAGVEVTHLVHAPPDCGSRSARNSSRVAPHLGEAARRADVAGEELLVDGERAGVHVADRVDQAHHPTGAAQVQAGQRLAVGGQVEERVAGEDVLAVGDQPVVELALLRRRGVQLVPDVGAAARRPQPGEAQRWRRTVGDRLELVELADVVPGQTTEILTSRKPAAARFSIARIAVANEPRPRTASLTSAVAPSSEICTST